MIEAPGRAGARWWWAVWAVLALLSAAVFWPAYLNTDLAWHLYMSRVVLHGGTAYVDVIDTNPPLILFLSVPPAWFAELLGVSAIVVFKVYMYLLAAASLLVCARLIRRGWTCLPEGARLLLVTALVFAVLPFARLGVFGQREHYMVLMTMPYVLAAAAWTGGQRLPGRWAALLGAIGGVGFAMKPHYLLAWIAIEAALLALDARRRSWRRPEAMGAVAGLAAYALTVVIFYPQYLPLAETIRETYGGLNSSATVMLRLTDVQIWIAALVLLLLVRLPRATRSLTIVLFAAWTGFLAGMILQFKGWNYHLYPGRALALMFFVTFAIALFQSMPSLATAFRGGVRALAAGLVAALVLSAGRYVLEAHRPAVNSDLVTPLSAIVRTQAPGGPIAILSMRSIMYPAFPLVNYTGAAWSLRFNCLWFLPGLYEKELQEEGDRVRFRAPAAMGALERRFYGQVIDDLCANPPALLLFEVPARHAPGGRRALDLAAYYGQDARYQRLSAAYAPLTTLGGFDVLKRVGAASCGASTAH